MRAGAPDEIARSRPSSRPSTSGPSGALRGEAIAEPIVASEILDLAPRDRRYLLVVFRPRSIAPAT